MNINQLRIIAVLERMTHLVKSEEHFAEAFSPYLDDMLDSIHNEDGFGTEGQSDPRGDFREGLWSCEKVEGIDKP